MDRQWQPQNGAGTLFQTASEDRTAAGPYWIKSTVQLAPTHVSSDHLVGASGTGSWSTAIPAHRRSAGQAPSFPLTRGTLGCSCPPSDRSARPTSHTAFSIQEGCPGFAAHGPQGATRAERALRLGACVAKRSSHRRCACRCSPWGGWSWRVQEAKAKGEIKRHRRSDSRPEREVTEALTTCVGFVCLFAVLCYVFRSWLFP